MGIEFSENNSFKNLNTYQTKPNRGAITNLVIKMGLAKDEKGANIVMIIISVICFILMFYIGF